MFRLPVGCPGETTEHSENIHGFAVRPRRYPMNFLIHCAVIGCNAPPIGRYGQIARFREAVAHATRP